MSRANVRIVPWQPPEALPAWLYAADLLLIPASAAPLERFGTCVLPMKTFLYLAAGRPILAAVPAGDARELVATSPVARLCAPTDARAMAEHVAAELAHVERHGRRPDAWPHGIERYERGALAVELADVLDRFVTRGESRRAPRGPVLRLVS